MSDELWFPPGPSATVVQVGGVTYPVHPDPWPMVSGVCERCGQEFCNYGGRCYFCERSAPIGEEL